MGSGDIYLTTSGIMATVLLYEWANTTTYLSDFGIVSLVVMSVVIYFVVYKLNTTIKIGPV